ncbi:hypothetical protein GIB67_021673 [Kingdonia uniflora]|uniref:Uncharacterized protein n=1 Tax=Kingdonia uniflora TaxID=39325 RepID=A0A7J7LM12_9MAGN|nr:hypothetical protein GIB67_021673 [Kingdonia uniflora]
MRYSNLNTTMFAQRRIFITPPPPPPNPNLIWDYLNMFAEPVLTRWPLSKLRDKALKITMKHFHYNDENSRYFTLGCVEKIYASKLNSEHTRYNKERATEKHNKLEEIIMKPEQKGQQKIRYAFSDKETPLENAHGYDLKPSSEDHVSHEDLTRLVRMVWTMLIVVKMMKWLIGRPFLT